jgi:hypothetical protein
VRNEYPCRCIHCGRRLEPGQGELLGTDPHNGGRWRVQCLWGCPDDEPEPPPPPRPVYRSPMAPDRPRCLQILGLPPDASDEAIKARYRMLAAVWHPDKGGDHERMAELNDAFKEAMRLAGKGVRV